MGMDGWEERNKQKLTDFTTDEELAKAAPRVVCLLHDDFPFHLQPAADIPRYSGYGASEALASFPVSVLVLCSDSRINRTDA